MRLDINQPEKKFYTALQVSKYLCIPLRTIYRLSKQGKLKAVKIGKHWRYPKDFIEQYSFGTDFSKEPVRIPSSSFTERRAYPRINSNFKCKYSINLQPFKNINSEGIIKNLSAGGVLLYDKQKIEKIQIDDPIKLRFSIGSDTEETSIKTDGIVIRKDNNCFGIKFRNIKEYYQNLLIKYVGGR